MSSTECSSIKYLSVNVPLDTLCGNDDIIMMNNGNLPFNICLGTCYDAVSSIYVAGIRI